MMRIVDADLPSALKVVLSPSAVDVQLVGDDVLANDHAFTWERSVVKDRTPGYSPQAGGRQVYTHVSLQETISPREMTSIRGVVFGILSRLVEGTRFMCFIDGNIPPDDLRGLDNRIELGAYHEDLRMNGRLIIAEMDVGELKYSMAYLGNYDLLKGVALMPAGAAGMHSDLRLFEPMPTAYRNTYFQPPKYNALQIALNHGAFFFEEINNGTRLRLVSTALSQAELARRVGALLEELDRPLATRPDDAELSVR